MRMSCNGCRVLRKGCSENCSIRPCLQWIKSHESQANATVFLAKFYGRAGLVNLINAGPNHLRPAIFRSLLYEACGRIVNPIYGSVGLLWSGSWPLCQTAVEAVLEGAPILQIPSDTAAANPAPPLKAKDYDIRHVSKDQPDLPTAAHLHKVAKASRTRFKHTTAVSSANANPQPSRSHESSTLVGLGGEGDSRENESIFSVETVEASHVSQGELTQEEGRGDGGEIDLDLTLGLDPACRGNRVFRSPTTDAWMRCDTSGWDDEMGPLDLGLELPA